MRGIDILNKIENSLLEKRDGKRVADFLNVAWQRHDPAIYQYTVISGKTDIATYVKYFKYDSKIENMMLELEKAGEKHVNNNVIKEANDKNSILYGSYGEHHENLCLLPRLKFEEFIKEGEEKVLGGKVGVAYGITIANKEKIWPEDTRFRAIGNSVSFYFTNIEQQVLGMNPNDKVGFFTSGDNFDIHLNARPLQTNIDEIKRVGNDTQQLLDVLEKYNIYDEIKEFQKKTSVNII